MLLRTSSNDSWKPCDDFSTELPLSRRIATGHVWLLGIERPRSGLRGFRKSRICEILNQSPCITHLRMLTGMNVGGRDALGEDSRAWWTDCASLPILERTPGDGTTTPRFLPGTKLTDVLGELPSDSIVIVESLNPANHPQLMAWMRQEAHKGVRFLHLLDAESLNGNPDDTPDWLSQPLVNFMTTETACKLTGYARIEDVLTSLREQSVPAVIIPETNDYLVADIPCATLPVRVRLTRRIKDPPPLDELGSAAAAFAYGLVCGREISQAAKLAAAAVSLLRWDVEMTCANIEASAVLPAYLEMSNRC